MAVSGAYNPKLGFGSFLGRIQGMHCIIFAFLALILTVKVMREGHGAHGNQILAENTNNVSSVTRILGSRTNNTIKTPRHEMISPRHPVNMNCTKIASQAKVNISIKPFLYPPSHELTANIRYHYKLTLFAQYTPIYPGARSWNIRPANAGQAKTADTISAAYADKATQLKTYKEVAQDEQNWAKLSEASSMMPDKLHLYATDIPQPDILPPTNHPGAIPLKQLNLGALEGSFHQHRQTTGQPSVRNNQGTFGCKGPHVLLFFGAAPKRKEK
jgi:hypothetical protein